MMAREKRSEEGTQHVCSVGRRCSRSDLHTMYRYQLYYFYCCVGRVHLQGFSTVTIAQLKKDGTCGAQKANGRGMTAKGKDRVILPLKSSQIDFNPCFFPCTHGKFWWQSLTLSMFYMA